MNRIITSSIAVTLFCCFAVTSQSKGDVYELRTYTTNEGKLDDLNARFRDHTVRIFKKHGIESVGYWVPTDKKNTLVYVIKHESRDAAKKSWKAFMADPEWKKAASESQKDGRILSKAPESVYMESTDYSPQWSNGDEHVFELRVYKAADGKLGKLDARFRDHTIGLFEKHGIRSVAYWHPTDEPDSKNTLIYIIAHKSRDAAKESWRSFSADPQWKNAAKESGVGRLVKRPESTYMKATDYSAIHPMPGRETRSPTVNAKPNIIVFLADDLGYADVGFNGCKDIPTPHIDSIAENGVQCTDAYANHPVCSPSRAGLLSGMYQQRFGFENNSGPEDYAATNFGVPRDIPMLGERLSKSGYATCMVGKWHVGFQEGLRPHERGFDSSYVFHSGARTYYPIGPRQNNQLYRNGKKYDEETEYITDAFAQYSVDFIDQHLKSDRAKDPFFLFFSFNAVHLPLEATEQYESRFPKIAGKKRKTYAGMLSALDDAMGSVMLKVKESGMEDNTLVFFYSDNGGPTAATTSKNDPLRGFKGQMFEGGIRIPFAVQWPDRISAGKTFNKPIMGFDVHATALAAAGFEVPDKETIDGKDLVPYLDGSKSGQPHDQLFWRSGRQHAVRVGNWKLVKPRGGSEMLFDLSKDIGEKNDLAKINPDKFAELKAAFSDWSRQMESPRWIRQDRQNAEPGGKLKSASKTPR